MIMIQQYFLFDSYMIDGFKQIFQQKNYNTLLMYYQITQKGGVN